MTWINPKTNWNSETYINASDFNRIEGNLTHIHGLFEQLFPSMDWSQYATQTTNDIPYTSKWVIVEGQLENLNKKSYELNIGNRKTFSENGHYIDYNELNRIENACLTLFNRMTSQIANNTAPVITITSNTIDWTSSATYDVTGKVTSNGNGISDAYLYYGDNKYPLTLNSSGEFTKRITLQPGVNNLSVRSRDLDGNPRFYEFTKKYDSTLPVITITSAQSSWSTSSAYTVTGKVADAESGIASATITTSTGVSETALTLDASGNFSYPITLNNTDNTITIKATNGAGRQSTTTFHAYYDTIAPTISITSSTAATVNPTYTLQGSVTDAQSGVASVTINGVSVALSNNSFSKAYTLSPGVNTFTIVAKDNAGRQATTTASVTLVNDKNNASRNWSSTYTTTDTARNNRGETATANDSWVTIDGVGYKYNDRAPAKSNYNSDTGGYGFVTAIASIDSTIPLPRGLSSVAISGSCGGEAGTGYSAGGNLSITIKDFTTNTIIASNSRNNAGSVSVSAGITQEQALHDLRVIITGGGSGTQHTNSSAWVGIGIPTFTWY